tara:strand:+ start:126 stop:308 length:183 start_codon:yes stop_codon:yes gene_type:complete
MACQNEHSLLLQEREKFKKVFDTHIFRQHFCGELLHKGKDHFNHALSPGGVLISGTTDQH